MFVVCCSSHSQEKNDGVPPRSPRRRHIYNSVLHRCKVPSVLPYDSQQLRPRGIIGGERRFLYDAFFGIRSAEEVLPFTVWSDEQRTIVILPEENGLLAYHDDKSILAIQEDMAFVGQDMFDVLVQLESDFFTLEFSNQFQAMSWRYQRHLSQEDIQQLGIDFNDTVKNTMQDLHAIKDVYAVTDSNESNDKQSIPNDFIDDVQIPSSPEDILPAKRVFVFVSDDFSNVHLPSLKRQRL